jgi:hypothetical protein
MTPSLLADWAATLPADDSLPPVYETRPEDVEEDDLARMDAKFHRVYGRDETRWDPDVTRGYLTSRDAIHDYHHPQKEAA